MSSRTSLLLAVILALSAAPAAAAPGASSLERVTPSGESATFAFSEVSGSTWYYLYISTPSVAFFKKWYRASEITCDAQTCTITPAVSLPPGQYRWWVQTWNDSGKGPWSNQGDFAMGSAGDDSGIEFDLDPSVGAPIDTIHWIDHLAFRPGSEAVSVYFDAFDSGVGSGVTGLQVEARTAGDLVIEQGLAVPPGLLVNGVRLCFESSAPTAFIDEVRIEQLSDPPDATDIVLLDSTDLALAGAQCVDTAAPASAIDPAVGGLRLQVSFVVGSGERVVLRGVGLQVVSDDNDPIQVELRSIKQALETITGHTHEYLTGRGTGHNNTRAVTSAPIAIE